MKLKPSVALLGLALTTTLYGCGGGGSGSDSSPSGTSTPPAAEQPGSTDNDTSTPTGPTYSVTGMAADGYLVNAEVCADLNGDGLCGTDEPSAYSDGTGAFELAIPENEIASQIIVQAIPGVTVDLDTNQPVTGPFTLKAPVTEDQLDVFVSPLTTLVANRMDETGEKANEALRAVADTLGVGINPLEDFITAGQKATDPRAIEEYAKAHRVAQVLARLEGEIRNKLDGNAATNTDSLAAIQDDLASRVASIARDIEETLAASFDPDAVAAQYPVDYVVRDIANGTTEVDRRMAGADMTINPFFESTGGRASRGGVNELFLTYNQDTGKVHYQRLTTEWLPETSESTVYLNSVPANVLLNSDGFPESTPAPDESAKKLVWSSQDGEFKVVDVGFGVGERSYEPAANGSDKMLDSTAFSGAVRVASVFEGFSLRYINDHLAVNELFGKTLPNDLFTDPYPGILPDGTWAYKTNELFLDHVMVAPWDDAAQGERCENGTTYTLDMSSCNVMVSGYMLDANKTFATSMADLAYPADYEQTSHFVTATHLASDSDRAMIFTTDGEIHIYPAPRYVRDEFGQILSAEPFARSEMIAKGTWRSVANPYPYIWLQLPAGYEYNVARGDFHTGNPILFEYQGYLRNGWKLPLGANVASVLGFDHPRILVNNLTATRIGHILKDAGVLADTPLED